MQNGVLSKNKQDTENVVHLSTFSQNIVLDDVKNVLNDYINRNRLNFPGSMPTSGLQMATRRHFLGIFYDFFL